MQIAIIVLLAVVIAMMVAVLISIFNSRALSKSLSKSLATALAVIYEHCESLETSSSEIVGKAQANHAEIKELLSRILEMEVSNSQLLTKILENTQQSGTTILDEDGKVINTLTFSQRKSERKLKVVQSKQSKVEVDEKN